MYAYVIVQIMFLDVLDALVLIGAYIQLRS